jgi:hypothetical protein
LSDIAIRHARGGGHPVLDEFLPKILPFRVAFLNQPQLPGSFAGEDIDAWLFDVAHFWIPAFAGMTLKLPQYLLGGADLELARFFQV